MVTWCYGRVGAGKTRTARALAEKFGSILLDADEVRKIWPYLEHSEADRRENNLMTARLARLLDEQTNNGVVVATVCPYADLRTQVQNICKCRFVYVQGGLDTSSYNPFEE